MVVFVVLENKQIDLSGIVVLVIISKSRAGALVLWSKPPAWKVGDRGFEPSSGIQVLKKNMFLPRSRINIQYCGEP